MRRVACHLALSLLGLAVSLGPGAPAPPPRLRCAEPPSLHLRRFEDGSAWLLCGHRLLARVAVPG